MELPVVWVRIAAVIMWTACGPRPPVIPTTLETGELNPRSPGYTLEQAVARLTDFRDAMCACKEEACTHVVSDDVISWQQALSSASVARGWTFTEVDQAYMDKLTDEMIQCSRALASDRPPRNVKPNHLEARWLAGYSNIVPDGIDKVEISRLRLAKVVTAMRMCIGTDGNVSSLKLMKSSGFPDYDARIEHGMSTWRYLPSLIDGKVAPMCTIVTFTYTQKEAALFETPPTP
ncbi:MAG: hypothetical protein ABIY55_15250 [Kofleriaceae bacterium]